MLLIQDQIIKLGGIMLSGQVKSIDISQTATIDEIEDDKGKTKATQPTGYEAAKISVEFILEDSDKTVMEQIADMQRLFKEYGQTTAKLLSIINEDCAARGIGEVYFKSLSTRNIVANSGRTATLELVTPVLAGVQTITSTDESTVDASNATEGGNTRPITKSTKKISKSPVNEVRRLGTGNIMLMKF